MNAGEPGAPLHLKIRAYHVDLSRGAVERPGLILEQIGSIVLPRLSYLSRIDPDGTRPLEDLRAEVRAQETRKEAPQPAEEEEAAPPSTQAATQTPQPWIIVETPSDDEVHIHIHSP